MTNLVGQLGHTKSKRAVLFNLYLGLVSSIGLALIIWGGGQVWAYESRLNFLLLTALAMLAAVVTTSMPLPGDSGVTYHIGSAISIAATPSFGVGGAVVIATVQGLVAWLIKPTDQKTWKKTGRQLAFNLGMDALSIFTAGNVLHVAYLVLGVTTFWGVILPWLLAAFTYEEVNLWLLIGVLRLQQGPSANVLELWRADRWATQIDILLMAIGGAILAFALQHYDWLGVVMFFLPIGLSAYAFHLYVQQMQAHLDNLEQIISDRTQALTHRTQELAETNQQKDAFLSVLSHDMMTPLANIRFSAEMLREDPATLPENKHLAQLILYSQATLHHLVRNILDLAKLQSLGALPMQKAPVELDRLLTQITQVIQGQAEEKGIQLTYERHNPTLWITADGQQMERIFLNLISNAVKYTADGGAISVSTELTATQVAVHVQDNGYGIPAEELPYIYERFRRVKQLEGKASGTGLGLAITKALVEQHNGRIEVVSEVNVGSRFTVILPLA